MSEVFTGEEFDKWLEGLKNDKEIVKKEPSSRKKTSSENSTEVNIVKHVEELESNGFNELLQSEVVRKGSLEETSNNNNDNQKYESFIAWIQSIAEEDNNNINNDNKNINNDNICNDNNISNDNNNCPKNNSFQNWLESISKEENDPNLNKNNVSINQSLKKEPELKSNEINKNDSFEIWFQSILEVENNSNINKNNDNRSLQKEIESNKTQINKNDSFETWIQSISLENNSQKDKNSILQSKRLEGDLLEFNKIVKENKINFREQNQNLDFETELKEFVNQNQIKKDHIMNSQEFEIWINSLDEIEKLDDKNNLEKNPNTSSNNLNNAHTMNSQEFQNWLNSLDEMEKLNDKNNLEKNPTASSNNLSDEHTMNSQEFKTWLNSLDEMEKLSLKDDTNVNNLEKNPNTVSDNLNEIVYFGECDFEKLRRECTFEEISLLEDVECNEVNNVLGRRGRKRKVKEIKKEVNDCDFDGKNSLIGNGGKKRKIMEIDKNEVSEKKFDTLAEKIKTPSYDSNHNSQVFNNIIVLNVNENLILSPPPLTPIKNETKTTRTYTSKTVTKNNQIPKVPQMSFFSPCDQQTKTNQIFGGEPNMENQYNLESLIKLLKQKIYEIQEYQRKTVLKINYGKEDDNFTEKFLEAIDSEEKLQELERSQILLSQETVIFEPKLIKQSSMMISSQNEDQSQKIALNESKVVVNDLIKTLESIKKDKSIICDPDHCEFVIPQEIIDRNVMQKMLKVFEDILKDAENDIYPSLLIRNQRNWSDVVFENNRIKLNESKPLKIIKKYSNSTRYISFDITLWILMKIVDLIRFNTSVTKRELYYLMKDIYKKVKVHTVEDCITNVSVLLEHGPWDLRILSTAKGLIYGDLKMYLSTGEVIVCNIPGGVHIPQNVFSITKIESNASFILVLEKDTVFQNFIKCDFSKKLGCKIIMITAKGYPDLNTRLFLKKLWKITSLPVFVLVDCDPFGIDIMLRYRFSSLAQAHLVDYLALPELRWLGVFPSDIASCGLNKLPLNKHDYSRIDQLLKRPYINSVPNLKEELCILLKNGVKINIDLTIKHKNYMSDIYFPTKLRTKKFY